MALTTLVVLTAGRSAVRVGVAGTAASVGRPLTGQLFSRTLRWPAAEDQGPGALRLVQLDEQEQRWLSGADGAAHRFAMSLMVAAARVAGADRFVPIEMAHVSSCHYSGPFSVDRSHLS